MAEFSKDFKGDDAVLRFRFSANSEQAVSGDGPPFSIGACPNCGKRVTQTAFGYLNCDSCERVMIDFVWIPHSRFLVPKSKRSPRTD